MTWITVMAAAMALASSAGLAQPAQPDETLPGFKATQLYSSFGTDNINVFSGDPGIVIPLGPEYALSAGTSWQLKAYYSAKFWHLFQGACREQSPCGGVQTAMRGQVTGYPTLGVGWTLELGNVTGRFNSVTNQFSGVYVSPDGQSHPFVITGTSGSGLVDDGSQLRVTRLADSTFQVWQPDGTMLNFAHAYLRPIPVNGFDFSSDDRDGQARSVRYGLSSIVDRFGQTILSVNYQQAYPNESAWKVSQVVLPGAGVINFFWGIYGTADGTWDVLVAIDFPVAPPATTLHVGFSFPPSADFLRTWDGGGSVTCVPAGPRTTNLPFLRSITQLSQVHAFEYQLTQDVNIPNGVLNAMTLPTGARIEYDYSLFTAPPPVATEVFGNPELAAEAGGDLTADGAGSVFGGPGVSAAYDDCSADAYFQQYLDLSPAVITRRERVSAGGAIVSEVSYSRDQFGSRDLPQDRFVDPERVVRRIIITRPDGNGSSVATKVIFHATPYRAPMEVSRREYGSLDTAGAPLRAVISCYDQQSMILGSGCGVAGADGRILDFSEAYFDRRSKTVTWYGPNPAPAGGDCADSGTPCWQRSMSAYNTTAFEFETEKLSSNSQILLYQMDSHTTTTHWTPYVDSSHWLLKLFDRQTVSDDYSAVPCPWQPCSVRADYGFNSQNGFLNTYSITDPTYGTLRRAFQDDGAGNPWIEVLSGDSPTGALTGFLVTRRSFARGRVLTSQIDGITWKAFDATRDASTGWIAASRDPNGLQSSYEYDALGRLTKVTPPGGEAATTYCYVDWSSANPTQRTYVLGKKGITNSCSTDDGAPLTGSASLEAYQFDLFGRIQREVRRLPNTLSTGSYLSFRESRYDPAGHRSFLSEWTPCGTSNGASDVRSCFATSAVYGTAWSDFDFLGRPKRVVAADGAVTTHTYDDPAGIPNSDFVDLATQTRTYTDASGQLVTGPLTSGFRKNILGRTLLVAEPGPPPYGPVTAYQYNVLNKLTMVNLAGTSAQQRTFAYDWFGFLRAEAHPESGAANHTVFDVLGNALSSTRSDGSVITRQYDQAGRPVRVTSGGQTYAVQCFDGGGCADGTTGSAGGTYPLGRLTRRSGWNPGSASLTRITEDFIYSGPGGRLSDKTTSFSTGTLPSVAEHWFYDSLGFLRQYDHPRAPGGTPFVVSTVYASGLPVAEYADGVQVVKGIKYQPSGGTSAYVTGLGIGHDITATITQDASLMPRPASFAAVEQASGSSLLSTGTYSYDSAGNITSIGPDLFRYDALSRLTNATLSGAGSEAYTYDPYGNLLSKAGVSFAVNPGTNRAGLPYRYDNRGNVIGTPSFNYTYDALDRQATHQDGSSVWNYLFAGDNERLVRVLPPALGQPVYTLRDEGRRVAAEYVGASISRDNVFLGNLLVVSLANTQVNGSVDAWHFYASDHLGSPRLDAGVAGNMLDSRKYWPFGESVAPPQSNQRIRFAAMEVDSEAGSRYYDHARSHDGVLGRFLSPDRLGGRILNPQTWNRYAYASNNPLLLVDPTGLWSGTSCGSFFDECSTTPLPTALEQSVQQEQIAATGRELSSVRASVDVTPSTEGSTQSLSPAGLVVSYGVSGEAGIGFAGIGGQAGFGGGVFFGEGSVNVGAFGTLGGTAGLPDLPEGGLEAGDPNSDRASFVSGAAIGKPGFTVGLTNATSVNGIGGPFYTATLTVIGVGLSLSYDPGSRVWVAAGSQQTGVSFSLYQTTTSTVPIFSIGR